MIEMSANTPTQWCSRMHMVPKNDRTWRMTVDLWSLNSATFHQTHIIESLFIQTSKIPPGIKDIGKMPGIDIIG